MATYNSTKVLLNANSVNMIPPRLEEKGETVVIATRAFTTANTLTSGDTIQLLDAPAGAYFNSVSVDSDILDAGTVAVTFTIGDAAVNDRYLATATTAQAGGFQGGNQNGVMGRQWTTNTRIVLYVTHSAGGAVPTNNNSIRVRFVYTAEL